MKHFAAVPDPPVPSRFWFDWGPVFYRGRLNGSAKVLCIASDPGATERIAHRVLVGTAGQRAQGFLAKLGLTRSYLFLNAFAWGLFPSQASTAAGMLADPTQRAWRNRLYDLARTDALQAVVAFGGVAQHAVRLWPGKAGLPLVEVPHPSIPDLTVLVNRWRAAVSDLRSTVTPDPDGDPTAANYGPVLQESDYAAIPRADLPFGVPAFLGDDAWKRRVGGRTSVYRPTSEDPRILIWDAPRSGDGG